MIEEQALEELHRKEKHLRKASEELRKAGFGTTEPPRESVQIALENVMDDREALEEVNSE